MNLTHKTHKALNKRSSLLGVELIPCGICVIAFIVAFKVLGVMSGASIFILMFSGFCGAYRYDPDFLRIIPIVLFFKEVYDPFEREIFKVTLK